MTYESDFKTRMFIKINKFQVTFEPDEITARSSIVSSRAKRQSPVNKYFKSTIFNENDVLAQLNNGMMAEINDEEFLSGSKMVQQLSIDEAFWKQNRTYYLPVNPEKQKVDCSSFSGFIGDIDLSLEYVYFCMYIVCNCILCNIHVTR